MIFQLEYYRSGRLIGGSPYRGASLDSAINVAKMRMILHHAASAKIFTDDTHQEVWCGVLPVEEGEPSDDEEAAD